MTTANQRMSNKHEAEVAVAFGGYRTPMSGAGWVRKNDVHTATELIECKATESLSYSIKLSLLEELETQSLLASKPPVLDIKFHPLGKRPRRYVVVPEGDYLSLRDAYQREL